MRFENFVIKVVTKFDGCNVICSFYGNDITRRRPRAQAYRSKSKEQSWRWPEDQDEENDDRKVSSRRPTKAEQEQFWKSWNAWYKKQVDVKEQVNTGNYDIN